MAPSGHPATGRPPLCARRLAATTALAAALALSGCSHAWDDYDPRIAGGVAGSTASGGGAGGAPGTGSTSTTTSTTTSSGMGGAGGMPGAGGSGGGFPPGCPDGYLPLADDFNDGVLGPDWGTFSDGVSSVSEEGGGIVVTMPDPAVPESHSGVYSVASYDLNDCAVFARVTDIADPATHAFTHLYAFVSDEVGYVEVVTNQGYLLFQKIVAGNIEEVAPSVLFDPVEHAYWRLRGSAGITYWETSADARTWVIRGSEPNPVPLDSVSIGLAAGTYQPEPVAPGVSRFDSLNLP